jgi:hypothetical protein
VKWKGSGLALYNAAKRYKMLHCIAVVVVDVLYSFVNIQTKNKDTP